MDCAFHFDVWKVSSHHTVHHTPHMCNRILPPATVTRVRDANVVHLENEIPFNGSFRLFVFGGKPPTSKKALQDLSSNLQSPESFYARFSTVPAKCTNLHHEQHNPHSRFFTICLTLAAKRADIQIADLPALFQAYSSHVYADDLWDKRVPDAQAAAHAKVGLDIQNPGAKGARAGGVVVVRPDGHVGCVVRLVEGRGTVQALEEYFGGFVVGGRKGAGEQDWSAEEGKSLRKVGVDVRARL